MLNAAEGSGSSFRLGIPKNDISINDYRACFLVKPNGSPTGNAVLREDQAINVR
jgi:hypothetical protein